MEEIKIEKGIPVPAHRVGRRAKYPFAEMDVNDSFEVNAAEGESPAKTRNRLFNAARSYGGGRGKRFVARSTETGARIWRIE